MLTVRVQLRRRVIRAVTAITIASVAQVGCTSSDTPSEAPLADHESGATATSPLASSDRTVAELAESLPDYLTATAAKYEVPGAQLAVSVGDEVVEAAAGVLNLDTGVEVTTDSVFQIGSITKVLTATLVMQLVDEGMLDLDEPVQTYLPEFRVADEEASAAITARHLLTHTAGFDGSIQTETTRGDDAVQRYVEDVLPEMPQHFPPGELFSYNNAGFGVLGRLIEVQRDMPYRRALREFLIEPLGLEHVAYDADEAILFRAAVGHVSTDDTDQWTPATNWGWYGNAPAGSMLAMPARELLEFGRMHLRGGVAIDGTRVLPEDVLDDMQTGNLGWGIGTWGTTRVLGHSGGTIGQQAWLSAFPDHDAVFVLLTNGGRADELHRELVDRVLGKLIGVQLPPPVTIPDDPEPVSDPDRYVGTYANLSTRIEIEVDPDGRLWATYDWHPPEPELAELVSSEPERIELVPLPLDAGSFVADAEQPSAEPVVVDFTGTNAGRAMILHYSGRALPRTDGAQQPTATARPLGD